MTYHQLIHKAYLQLSANKQNPQVAFLLLYGLSEQIKNMEDFKQVDNKQVPTRLAKVYFDKLDLFTQKQVPLVRLLGFDYFYNYLFYVHDGVFAFRKETEQLVNEVIGYLNLHPKYNNEPIRVLDACAGSGVIGICLKLLRKDLEITCLDFDDKAIANIQANALFHNVDIEIIKADLKNWNPQTQYDVIVCNPPYIALSSCEVEENVLAYDPHHALFDTEPNGISFYEHLFKKASSWMQANSLLACEIGYDQKAALLELLTTNNYEFIEYSFKKDLNCLDRYLLCKKGI